MKRFQPIEIFILRAEGLPATRISQKNDVFCEVALGYNMTASTRVHHGAGHTCVFKESVHLNFDPFDLDMRLHLVLKNQGPLGSDIISQAQLGAAQVEQRVVEASQNLGGDALVHERQGQGGHRLLGWAATADMRSEASMWAPNLFKEVDLVPSGRLWIRIVRLPQENEGSWLGWCCCWPASS